MVILLVLTFMKKVTDYLEMLFHGWGELCIIGVTCISRNILIIFIHNFFLGFLLCCKWQFGLMIQHQVWLPRLVDHQGTVNRAHTCLLSAPAVGLKSHQTHPVLSCRIFRQILSAPGVGLKRQQTYPVLSRRIFRQILSAP